MYQHLEYFPYGETWVEDGGSGQMPYYRFTGKELDPETGLYYYGARYYDPVLSRWISADPAFGKFLPTGNKKKDENLPGIGGVFNPVNLNHYSYTQNNPVNLIDPDGRFAGRWDIDPTSPYGVVTGMQAHKKVFAYLRTHHPMGREFQFDQPLYKLGLGFSMNRPDVILPDPSNTTADFFI